MLGRIDALLDRFTPDVLVYICGDCPLVDPGFIDHAVRSLSINNAFDVVALREDCVSIHEGIHVYTQRGWKKMLASSVDKFSREHIGHAQQNHPSPARTVS